MKNILCIFGFLMIFAATAHATVVNFNTDTLGNKANGFTSGDSAILHFSDSIGADLRVANNPLAGCPSNCLLTLADDASFLIMDFDVLVNSISLDFGNDESFGTNPVRDAVLTVFLNNIQVGQSVVTVNNNDLMDQSIAFTGTAFDRATFLYRGANNAPATLIEAVDNIEFNAVVTVPEPGILALLGIGLVGLSSRSRKH